MNANTQLIAAAQADTFTLEKVEENDLILTLNEIFGESLFGEGEKITQLFQPLGWDDGYLAETENTGVYRLYLIKRGGKSKESLDFRIIGSYLESHGSKFTIDTVKGEVTAGQTKWIITDHEVFLKTFTEIING